MAKDQVRQHCGSCYHYILFHTLKASGRPEPRPKSQAPVLSNPGQNLAICQFRAPRSWPGQNPALGRPLLLTVHCILRYGTLCRLYVLSYSSFHCSASLVILLRVARVMCGFVFSCQQICDVTLLFHILS